MPDTILALYFAALCALAAAWILTYRAIFHRLKERHAMKAARLFGTPDRRKNGMDQFFSLLGFLFEDQTSLGDMQLKLACIALKAMAVAFVLTFFAMMFTPFFLQLSH